MNYNENEIYRNLKKYIGTTDEHMSYKSQMKGRGEKIQNEKSK